MRDGEPADLVVTRQNNVVTMTSGELAVSFSAVASNGKVAPLMPDGSIKVEAAQKVRATVAGFGGGTDVEMWLMSTPVLLGTSKVGLDGRADSLFRLPSRIDPGKHRLVFKGVDWEKKDFVVSMGITVGGKSGTASWSRVFLMILLFAAAFALFLPAAFRRRRRPEE